MLHVVGHAAVLHAPNAQVGLGTVQRSSRPISENVHAQNGSGRGPYPSGARSFPTRLTCPPTRRACYPSWPPRRHSVPVPPTSSTATLPVLLHDTSSKQPSCSPSISRFTMAISLCQAIDEQDDTAFGLPRRDDHHACLHTPAPSRDYLATANTDRRSH